MSDCEIEWRYSGWERTLLRVEGLLMLDVDEQAMFLITSNTLRILQDAQMCCEGWNGRGSWRGGLCQSYSDSAI